MSSRLPCPRLHLSRRYVAAMPSIPLPFEKTGSPVMVPIRVSDPSDATLNSPSVPASMPRLKLVC